MKTLILTGYRSFELSVFQEKDPKIQVIKKVIKMTLQQYVEAGLEWVLIGGNLGCELWGAQTVLELQENYPELKLGVIFPFKNFGEKWNDTNQQLLQTIVSQADYVNATSHQDYQNPSQLRNHTQFLLDHSDGVVAVYDPEFPGKLQYFLKETEIYSENHDYLVHLVTMDDLQNASFDS